MTDKQRKYAELRAAGADRPTAYTGAGYSSAGTRKTLRQNAEILEKRSAASPEILARIKELQDAAAAGAILERDARTALLSRIALDENETTRDRMRALDQLNRMYGDYTDRVQTTVTGGLSLSYAERLETMRAALTAENAPGGGWTPGESV